MRKQIVIIGGILFLTVLFFATVGVTTAGHSQTYTRPMRVHASQDPQTPVVPHSNARLTTSQHGARIEIRTSLPVGNAVTLWWVIINNPAACPTLPCTGGDILGNSAAIEAQVTYATGRVVNHGNQTVLRAHLPVGNLPNGWFEGQGFTNPTGAEIHVIINDHGPAIRQYMPDMVTTYRGGCTDESLPAAFPDSAKADGTPGPNTCRLAQFAIFVQE